MFRAAAVSIVLTLAVGQNVSLLCRTWCDRQAAAATCLHQGPATLPRVASDDHCVGVVSNATFLKEDVRRSASSTDTQRAVLLPRFGLAAVTTGAISGRETAYLRLPQDRLLRIALRI